MRTYKGKITREKMPENGIFVFGSNPLGFNGNPTKGTGGAALVAHLEFDVQQGEKMINKLSRSGKAYKEGVGRSESIASPQAISKG